MSKLNIFKQKSLVFSQNKENEKYEKLQIYFFGIFYYLIKVIIFDCQ